MMKKIEIPISAAGLAALSDLLGPDLSFQAQQIFAAIRDAIERPRIALSEHDIEWLDAKVRSHTRRDKHPDLLDVLQRVRSAMEEHSESSGTRDDMRIETASDAEIALWQKVYLEVLSTSVAPAGAEMQAARLAGIACMKFRAWLRERGSEHEHL